MPHDEYIYTERTWVVLAHRELDWQDVNHVLTASRPRFRYFHGEYVLVITATDRAGRWMRIVLAELIDTNDVYEIIDAHYPYPQEDSDDRPA